MEPSFLVGTASSFSLSSSDVDSETTFSFFSDSSISLGTLIGYRPDPSPSRSFHPITQIGHMEIFARRSRATGTQRGCWDFMTCASSKDGTEDGMSSLGHFLQAERRAGGSPVSEKVYINIMYEEADALVPEANPLFVESLLQLGSGASDSDAEAELEESREGDEQGARDGDCKQESRGRRSKRERAAKQRSWEGAIASSSSPAPSCAFHCVSNRWGGC